VCTTTRFEKMAQDLLNNISRAKPLENVAKTQQQSWEGKKVGKFQRQSLEFENLKV